MPIIVFTAFYIPVGLQILARWLSKRTSKNGLAVRKNRQRWFFILVAVGFSICTAKFGRITPLRWEKQGYIDTAKWLKDNTSREDTVAVPDRRISFYAEREGLLYRESIPERAKYVVRIVKGENEELDTGGSARKEFSLWVNKKKKAKRIVLHKNL